MFGKPSGYIDIPGTDLQVKLHGSDDLTTLTGAYIFDKATGQPVGGNKSLTYMNGYEAAMIDSALSGANKGTYKK
ncbi:MAG: hypothetical protein O6829_07095 [Alphaproteobacteria bacterium]|nr:hypothetical protein [Alphaproteobacteria bacterium]